MRRLTPDPTLRTDSLRKQVGHIAFDVKPISPPLHTWLRQYKSIFMPFSSVAIPVSFPFCFFFFFSILILALIFCPSCYGFPPYGTNKKNKYGVFYCLRHLSPARVPSIISLLFDTFPAAHLRHPLGANSTIRPPTLLLTGTPQMPI